MTQGKQTGSDDTVENVATAGIKAGCGEPRENATMLSETDVAGEPFVALDERIQAQIGQQLSSFYRELVNQPIPQNFMDLLARLDRQEDVQGGDK